MIDYHDKQIIQLLKYGFPLGNTKGCGSRTIPKNHTGARFYQSHVAQLLQTEILCKSVIGPFSQSPFGHDTFLSPLNSVPKKDSEKRRLILDLSFPEGNSINSGIDKDFYLDEFSKLTLPSIDHLADRVVQLGRGCKVFKIDLQRGYRQFLIDPKDLQWLGYFFMGNYLFDCSLSMGSKSSAKCCQRVTSMVVFIHAKSGFFVINYLDDLGGAEDADTADQAFDNLRSILRSIGLQEAVNKTVFPCTLMVFLGIEVNTINLTLTIPQDKWSEIQQVLSSWQDRTSATKKQVQKLAGILNFACRCVRSGRIYLSGVLNFLRSFGTSNQMKVSHEVYEDVRWWREFAPTFNGISLMLDPWWSQPDEILSSDSCLTGGGAISNNEYIHWLYPKKLADLKLNINVLECLMVVVAVKKLGQPLARKKLLLQCDNRNSVLAINSGCSRDLLLQKCLRELHKTTAHLHCDVRAVYIHTDQNRVSDSLSRWYKDSSYRKIFWESVENKEVTRVRVTEADWEFILL